MSKEIERKFIVGDDSYRTIAERRHHIVQGYLSVNPDATVRVRIRDDKAFLTVKSRNEGTMRDEWEYEIPVSDAREMLDKCHQGRIIEKDRYVVAAAEDGLAWEVDEFHGCHEGLVVAEIELPTADTPFGLPDFIGREVTGDPAYYNSTLSGAD